MEAIKILVRNYLSDPNYYSSFSRCDLETAYAEFGWDLYQYYTKTTNGRYRIGINEEEKRRLAIVQKAYNKLLERYRRYCEYMTESRHNWFKVNSISWADNSVDEIQKSKLTGETRHKQVTAPHGDICF